MEIVESGPVPNARAGGENSRGGGQRQAVVVLGMHRSGTSAVAGCLHRLGVDFGPRLMPPTAANEKGYYEHIDVVNLHDRLLMALGRGWDTISAWPAGWHADEAGLGRFKEELLALLQRDFAGSELWGIKDPRLCRLLAWWRPLWAALATEPVYLIVVRDPREVADSLDRRDGMSSTKALILWMQHMLDAENQTRGCRRYFLRVSDFFHNWEAALAPLAGAIGPRWTSMLAAGRVANRGFLDGSLRKSSARTKLPEGWQGVVDWFAAQGAENSLVAACAGPEALLPADSLERLIAAQPASERLADAALELASARKLAAWYEAEWFKAKSRGNKYKERLDAAQKRAESR